MKPHRLNLREDYCKKDPCNFNMQMFVSKATHVQLLVTNSPSYGKLQGVFLAIVLWQHPTNTAQTSQRLSAKSRSCLKPELRIRSDPHPTPEFLSEDFCLQPSLEWKFLLRRTCCRGKNCFHCGFWGFSLPCQLVSETRSPY